MNNDYPIRETGYRLTVSSFGENNEPSVYVDVRNSEGTIVDRAILTVPVDENNQPQLTVFRMDKTAETYANDMVV